MTAPRFLLASLLLAVAPAHAAPLISEFLASNETGLKDEEGSREDWIEIRNPDATPVNLENWYLSDTAGNKTKWRFPAVTIPPNGHLIVFASSKNRAVAGQPLHTNFGLSANGEYLGLTQPDGVTTVSQYSPTFPKQYPDISYGLPVATTSSTLIATDAAVRWKVPVSSSDPGAGWLDPAFSDTSWQATLQGIGFARAGSAAAYLPEIGTAGNVESAIFGNSQTQTCYLRIPFTAPDDVVSLKLRVKYDDGFAAWVNGQPLLAGGAQLKRNAPATLAWNSTATGNHDDDVAIQFAEFDISENIPLLAAGNLLAIQALNSGPGSSDMLFRFELVATVATDSPVTAAGYFATPTPGATNGGIDTLVIPRKVVFSQNSGTVGSIVSLTLSGNEGAEEIRYTVDGSLPTASSPLYTGPISITGTRLVRARLRDPVSGNFGLLSSAHYERLDTNLTNYKGSGLPFRSALPILVLNNLNYSGEFPNDGVKRSMRVNVFDRDETTGYATITATPTLSTWANGAIRGSSSAGFPKKPYSVEFTDESGSATDATILGMTGEDFALVSCYDFDKAFMRNAWIYEMARQAGYWAPRTRLVEVFFNQNNNNLSYDGANAADYRGVYLLSEVVRRASDRVDITKIETSDTTLPAVSGGYILKIDRKDADEFAWTTNRNLPTNDNDGLIIHRPKLADLSTAQTDYIKGYFQQFEDALYTEQPAGFPTRNYRNYIESRSWVDHNLFNMFPKNVDGLRLSCYLQKDRGRRIEGGALWDFDRSADNTAGDNRDADPTQWYGTGDATRYFDLDWWSKLFLDIEFRQLYVDRWQTLRRGPLATANINSVLTGYFNEFKTTADPSDNPAIRDFAKWYGGSGSLASYTNELKAWLETRANWIDGQFAAPTTHTVAAGAVAPGTAVAITIPAGTRVYYTLDGSDPRAVNGGVSPAATEFTGGTLPLAQTTLLTSRAFRAGSYTLPATNWSGPLQSLYTVNEPYASDSNLRVTAIHFNPAPPTALETGSLLEVDASDFSWIEIRNNSTAPINLEGVTLVKSRPVSAVTLAARTLAPGEKGLLVKNRAAFTFRYGSGPAARIVGEWPGDKHLDLLEADLRLLARDGTTRIADFTYETAWIGAPAVAAGKAMEYISTLTTKVAYETPGNWRASTEAGGSPGEIAPEGYAAWRLSEFAGATADTGPLDDFDRDGLANLVEYLLGSDPKAFTPAPGTLVREGTSGLALDYTRRGDRTDATLSVWQSTGLDLWIPAESDTLISVEGALQHRRALFPAGGKGFLRFTAVAP